MKRLLLPLSILLLSTNAAPAQSNLKPLLWGADPNGGIPYVFRDRLKPQTFIGVEVDIAEALSRELGRPIEFRNRKFENLLEDLDRGDIDIAMNGLEINPKNVSRARFTKPYYLYQLQLVVRTDSPFNTLKELKEAGKKVGSLSGSAALDYLLRDDVMGKDNVKDYDDQDGTYLDLQQGAIDGVLLDLPAAIYYAAPDRKLPHGRLVPGLRFAGPPLEEGYYGIAVHKDNERLQNQLNAAIDKIRDSGELKRILQKWELWNADQYRIAPALDVEPDLTSLPYSEYFVTLLEGTLATVEITLASMAVAIVLGLAIATSRLYGPAPLRWLATIYVEFFRGIPVLLLLYFLYYGLGKVDGLKMDGYTVAILGFGLNYAAYEAEIYRAGLASIPLGQWEAAASLGMSGPRTFFRIVLPQAIRVILPPMTNDFVALFKDTSVVSIIAVTELSKSYQELTKASGGHYLELGLMTAALYLIMSVPLGYLSRYLEQRWGSK